MYTSFIAWLIIVLVVIVVVLLTKNHILKIVSLAIIIVVFLFTFQNFATSIKNTEIEKKLENKIEKKYKDLNLDKYTKTKGDKYNFKEVEYTLEQIVKKYKIPIWFKNDIKSAQEGETISKILARASARACIIAIYFLMISISIVVIIHIFIIFFKRIKKGYKERFDPK